LHVEVRSDDARPSSPGGLTVQATARAFACPSRTAAAGDRHRRDAEAQRCPSCRADDAALGCVATLVSVALTQLSARI
jgi:hypothetical protein